MSTARSARAASSPQTGQPLPRRNSERDALEDDADGSVDLPNWIRTVAGKGWSTVRTHVSSPYAESSVNRRSAALAPTCSMHLM